MTMMSGVCMNAEKVANANGMDRALPALSGRLNATLDLQLERAAAGSSRVVWLR